MENHNVIEINSTKSSKLLHDYLPAIIAWTIILFVIQVFSQTLGGNSRKILGIVSISTLPVVLYFTYRQSKTIKLDKVGLTITTKDYSHAMPWESIESISKVSKSEGDFMYEVLDRESNKYVFPLDNKVGRTEAFFDSLPQLSIVPSKTRFNNYSARWKNISSTSYKYTSFADKFMNFSYGDPNSK